jgi:hypothetical protein
MSCPNARRSGDQTTLQDVRSFWSVGFGTHEIVWGCVAEEVGYGYLRADFTPVGTTKIRDFLKVLREF